MGKFDQLSASDAFSFATQPLTGHLPPPGYAGSAQWSELGAVGAVGPLGAVGAVGSQIG